MNTPFEPGEPASKGMIPLLVPEIRGNEWRYIKDCLDTNWVSSVGAYVDRFERGIAQYQGAEYAVATASGTAALHIALLVAGVVPGDEVLVSSLTFVAPANAIRYCGAWPVFMDAEPEHLQMDPGKVAAFLERECEWQDGKLTNKASKRPIKAILPVHILGHSVDMDPILDLARRFDLVVIEDAAESLGAKYKDSFVGSLADIGCLSFNGNKVITTGGGGMIITDHSKWAERARYLTTQAKDDKVEFVHEEIGYNYRLTNIQAAMGTAQLEKLDEYIAVKREIAKRYSDGFRGVPGIEVVREGESSLSSCWLNTIRVEEAVTGRDSRELMGILRASGIQTRPLWHPIYTLPPHLQSQAYRIEVCDDAYAACLSLPSSVGLTPEAQDRVIENILHNVQK